MTDVWTSVGVVIGVGAVALTGWQRLDPIVAILVAANIVRSGVAVVRRSVLGLMDTVIPAEDLEQVRKSLDSYVEKGVQFHALRTRQAGARRFVEIHVIVPGRWTVHRGHRLLEQIEADIRQRVPNVTIFTHLESSDDPASWEDVDLDRKAGVSQTNGGTEK
jgi:cation diffusion facilitator family transporter